VLFIENQTSLCRKDTKDSELSLEKHATCVMCLYDILKIT